MIARAGGAFTLIVAFLALATHAFAQNDAQVRSILGRFKNWRYGNISVFKLDDETMKGVTQLLNPEPIMSEVAKKCAPAKQTQIDDKVAELGCAGSLDELLNDPEIGKLLKGECIDYAKYALSRKGWECNTFKKAYVVTTRYLNGQSFRIIGLLTSTSDSRTLERILASPRDIFLETQLRQSAAPSGSPAKTLYEYLNNFVLQQNESEGINVTAEAQGLGDVVFLDPVYGKTLLISEDDTQQYMRISEGQAMDYLKSRELIVSPDLISYRSYAPRDTAASITEGYVYNRNTPKFGVELRYGADPANYPSFFSERLSLNAMWGVNRLGIILPWNGWSSLGSSFGVERKLTYAGFGVNAAFDFPIKITNSGTGVFNMAGSYIFSDAVQSEHPPVKGEYATPTTDSLLKDAQNRPTRTRDILATGATKNDYLIRMNAQVHYTYAVSIDSGYFFRFRIGGSVYNRETWQKNEGNIHEEVNIYKYKDTIIDGKLVNLSTTKTLDTTVKAKNTAVNSWSKVDNRFIGGVSARLEFMATVGSTPYGFGIQYFDEAILGDAWLMVPINPAFALRFEGRMFTPILRDPYEWETNTVFVPTMRVIYNF